MKNASPSFLLSVASLLATFTALGAAAPDVGSRANLAADNLVDAAQATAGAMRNVGATSRAQEIDQLKAANAAENPLFDTTKTGDGKIDVERKRSFEFIPSGSAAREWAKLPKNVQEEVNRIGSDLVDFERDKSSRITKDRQEHEKRLNGEREPAEKEARANLNKARDARTSAGNALSKIRNDREVAERRLADAEAAVAEAQKRLDDVERPIVNANERLRDINRAVEAKREELGAADRDLLRANAALEERTQALAAAVSAREKADALREEAAKAKELAEKKADEAKKAFDGARSELEAKEGACDNAKDALYGKTGAKAAENVAAEARNDAEKGLKRARKELEAGKARSLSAEKEAAAAARAVDEARNALEKTKEDAARPRGWAARHLVPGWFQPSVPRAEKRLAAAEAAKTEADKAAADARSGIGGLNARVGEREKALKEEEGRLGRATKAREKAENALAEAKGAVQSATDAFRTKSAEFKKEKAAADKAGEAFESAKKKAEARAGDVAAAERAKSVAETEVVERRTAFDEIRETAKQLEEAKSPAERAGLLWKSQREAAQAGLEKARIERGKRQEALDKVSDRGVDLNRAQALYDEALAIEAQHRPNWEKARRALDNVRSDAVRRTAEDERNLRDRNAKKTDEIWEGVEKTLFVRESSEAGRGVDATDAEVPRKEAAASEAARKFDKAREEAKSAAETASRAARDAGAADKALRAADDAARSAQKAVAKAENAFGKAKAGDDAAATDAARRALDAAKSALAEAEARKAAAKKSLDEAGKRRLDLQKEAEKAADAVTGAKRAAEKAEKEAKFARDVAAANRKTAAGAASRAQKGAAILREAFDRQVRNLINHLPQSPEEAVSTDEMNARQIQEEYRKYVRGDELARSRAAYERARAALESHAARPNRVEKWKNDEVAVRLLDALRRAMEDYAKKRDRLAELEDRYNTFFSEADFDTDLSIGDAEADGLHNAESALRDLHGYRVKGDRRWLARTSVRPAFARRSENLLRVLLDEFAWQADTLAFSGDAARSETDPTRVELTAEKARECAEAAAAALKRRAIYSGFYFFGADVADDGGENAIWVDKGRFGPVKVNFGSFDENGEFVNFEGERAEDGRMYSAGDIVSKFASRDAPTNTLEGETFNFIAFRKRFNALNANPDIRRANVKFEPAPAEDFDYGYNTPPLGWSAADLLATNGTDAVTGIEDVLATNRMTRAIRTVVDIQENRRPAPIHGVLSIDNFNSMGNADKPAGEADTWMARLLLQRRLGLFSDEDSLALQGNVSLGGSLFGAAASYFVPRDEEARLWRSGDLADALAWTVHGGYTDVDQGDVIPSLDVLGTGYYGGLQLSTRVHDSGRGTWDVSAGFTYRRVENSVRIAGERIDLGPNGGDPYTLLPLSLALLYADKDLDSWRGRNYLTAELAYNLGGSSADELAAFRPAIDEDRYMILRAQFARLQLLWERSKAWWVPRMLFLRLDGQYALDPVIGAEQFGLGGHGTVRGYVEREFMGDQGLSASIEFRTPILLNPAWFEPRKQNPWKSDEQLQLVYFVDLGWYNLQDASPDGDDDNILLGLGLGLRYSLDDWRVLGRSVNPVFRLDWAYPVWQQNDVGDNATSSAGVVHASLQFPF